MVAAAMEEGLEAAVVAERAAPMAVEVSTEVMVAPAVEMGGERAAAADRAAMAAAERAAMVPTAAMAAARHLRGADRL